MQVKSYPAPWQAESPEDIDGENAIIVNKDGACICQVYGTDSFPCLEDPSENDKLAMAANAKLIIAAPDLLEALHFCRSVMQTQGIYDLSEKMAIEKANVAISKATE